MNSDNGGISCQLGCWAMAAAAGALTFILLIVLGGQGFIASVFLAAVVFALPGLLMNWLFCAPLPNPGARSGLRPVPPVSPIHLS